MATADTFRTETNLINENVCIPKPSPSQAYAAFRYAANARCGCSTLTCIGFATSAVVHMRLTANEGRHTRYSDNDAGADLVKFANANEGEPPENAYAYPE